MYRGGDINLSDENMQWKSPSYFLISQFMVSNIILKVIQYKAVSHAQRKTVEFKLNPLQGSLSSDS